MRAAVVGAVLRREFLEIVRNRLLVLSIVGPPAILTAIPIVFAVFGSVAEAQRIPPGFVEQIIATHPAWSDLRQDQVMVAFVMQQFMIMFLIIPGYIPLAIASYSIVGEKQTRSLEAVLATPIRTGELMTGKSVASLVPGVVAAWLAYLVMVTLVAVLVGPRMAAVVLEPTWLVAVLALGPAVGLVSTTAGVIVSSRVNDPRTAQQIGGVILLPVIALVVIQAVGTFVLEAQVYLAIAVVVGLVGLAGLRLGAIIFGRESILTRWK